MWKNFLRCFAHFITERFVSSHLLYVNFGNVLVSLLSSEQEDMWKDNDQQASKDWVRFLF